MLNQDYTAKVLNLEDVIITNVENTSEEPRAYIELPRKEHLALMFEITPRLADAYRLKNEFLSVMRLKSSTEGRHNIPEPIKVCTFVVQRTFEENEILRKSSENKEKDPKPFGFRSDFWSE